MLISWRKFSYLTSKTNYNKRATIDFFFPFLQRNVKQNMLQLLILAVLSILKNTLHIYNQNLVFLNTKLLNNLNTLVCYFDQKHFQGIKMMITDIKWAEWPADQRCNVGNQDAANVASCCPGMNALTFHSFCMRLQNCFSGPLRVPR